MLLSGRKISSRFNLTLILSDSKPSYIWVIQYFKTTLPYLSPRRCLRQHIQEVFAHQILSSLHSKELEKLTYDSNFCKMVISIQFMHIQWARAGRQMSESNDESNIEVIFHMNNGDGGKPYLIGAQTYIHFQSLQFQEVHHPLRAPAVASLAWVPWVSGNPSALRKGI